MPRTEARLRSSSGTKNEVGPRVRDRRKVANLTPDELCARIIFDTDGQWDVGVQEIYKIEGGRRAVNDVEVLALARALQCSPCYLLVGEDAGESGGKISASPPK